MVCASAQGRKYFQISPPATQLDKPEQMRQFRPENAEDFYFQVITKKCYYNFNRYYKSIILEVLHRCMLYNIRNHVSMHE